MHFLADMRVGSFGSRAVGLLFRPLCSWMLLACIALVGPGCATLLHGTHQEVSFRSEPEQAKVHIAGVGTFETPYSLSMERLEPLEVTFHAKGHEPVTTRVERKVSAVVIGNVFCLILPGLLVDFLTGAAYELADEVFVRLEPIADSTRDPSRADPAF